MSDYTNKLESKIWAIADEFKTNMDANEFRNYIFGFIFYRYLSEKFEEQKEDRTTSLGYSIEPQHLFSTIIEKAKSGDFILDDLSEGFNSISESHAVFNNLFEDVDLHSSKLGKSAPDKNKIISKILLHIQDINFELDNEGFDIFGSIYEVIISQFGSSAGKKGGEFYTPQEVSEILAKIVSLGKNKIKSVYDPTCGSGSLLLKVAKETKVGKIYGQELNRTPFNLARMNMLLHDVPFDTFDIKQEDTLEKPQHKGKKFEAIVANPPYSAKWSSDKSFLNDERFSACEKLAPKSKADYAFIQHMLHHLDENGTMAVVLPMGVLFRAAAEGVIRKYFISEKNYIDAVIGLPANIFYTTSISTCILVFKKARENQDILFIDASNEFEKIKNRNKLRPEDITKIVNTYANREEINKYSHKAPMEEIEENNFNLNLSRYVDTFEEEEPVDLDEVCAELEQIAKEMVEVDKEIKENCEELGIKAPIL